MVPERETPTSLPSQDESRLSSRPTLTELHSQWEGKRREAWLLRRERLRDTILLRLKTDRDKIGGLKPFHGIAFIDKEGDLYVTQWRAMGSIKNPELYTVLWPLHISDEKTLPYLTQIPQQRPFLFRAQLVKVRGIEKAIRFTRHVREAYLPVEGERTERAREFIVQIKKLTDTFSQSYRLTLRQIEGLTRETRDLIQSSELDFSRLPRVQEAVDRVWRASTMRDRTGRINPTACRQMLFSALLAMTQELELKHPQVQIKYAGLEAALNFEREQTRWILEQARHGLIHFLRSNVFRQPYLLGKMSPKQLVAEKRGMITYIKKVSQELDNQVKLQPYKPVAQTVILGLQGGEEAEYRTAGWRGDSATELISQGYFNRARGRIWHCFRRMDNVLKEYESVEKEED